MKATEPMADRDYYEVLDIPRDASPERIKKAYRTLARKYHPDVNPGDKTAEAKFKEAQQAYDILSDTEKRALYDRYGMAGVQGAAAAGAHPGGAQWSAHQAGPGFENVDFSAFFGPGFGAGGQAPGGEAGSGSLFEDLIGRVRGGRASRRPARGPAEATEAQLTLPFLTAVQGGETTVEVVQPDGGRESLVVKIPPGTDTGSRLRLKGQGPGGGDLLIRITVEPHPYYRREGRDLLVDVPITVGEAGTGARVEVPTLGGPKVVPIPAGTSSGKRLRLRGQGVPAHGTKPAGDLYVVPKIVLPSSPDEEGRRLLQQFDERNPFRPREGLW